MRNQTTVRILPTTNPMLSAQKTAIESFCFSSCLKDDVWHPKTNAKAYEWWYFDALSDDGRDAVVIIFLDNFIFSPRYNRAGASADNPAQASADAAPSSPLPAVAFFYYRNGKPLYRAINEFSPNEFATSTEKPFCRIGENQFEFKSAPYGSGYLITLKTAFHKNFRLEAQFEWLAVESDFKTSNETKSDDSHNWNLAVPRADVSGKINVENEKGKNVDMIQFRGTGYHDHNYDQRWLPETVRDWQWGRAHFNDSTAVFYRYQDLAENTAVTKLLTVRNGQLRERSAEYDEQNLKRDIFGIRFPQRMTFQTDDQMRLRVKHLKTIDSSFFYLRFLSEMTLTLRDGKPRKTVGITEFLAPKTLKYRWLDWLIDMRIGRDGKGAKMK